MSNALAELFQDQANAIREGLGDIGKLAPADYATRIREINALIGSGSSDDVRYVTFMSEDGTEELLVKPVAAGDDCADVVARGLIDAPTKESTAQYEYSFSGWSTTSGGSAEEDALKNVTADKIVYAAFNAEVRTYTVRFFDGDTLVDTVTNVPYGSTAETDYTKNGYELTAWTPSNENITGDTDCYGTWVEAETISDDWATISAHAMDGTASSVYKVGDTKAVTLTNSDGTTENIIVVIAGFGLHRNTDGVKDGITFIRKGRSATRISQYADSAVNIDSRVYDTLPADLKAVIRQSKVSEMLDETTGNALSHVENEYTRYLFQPELANISTSLTFSNGSTTITQSMGSSSATATEYANSHDATLFPLFSGKTKAEIKDFFGVKSGVSVRTRTLLCSHPRINGYYSSITNRMCLSHNDNYTLVKHYTSDAYYTFCFRV